MRIEKEFMFCEVENKVAKLTFNRPPLNLFNLKVFSQFSEMADEINELVNKDEVRVVILSSGIEKAFSAGDDVKGGPETSDEAIIQNNLARAAMKKMGSITVPVIVAVNGYVMGGGAVLALTGDYIISADDAKFAFSEIDFGMFPNWGITLALGRRFDLPVIKRLLYTGERYSPEFAKEMGMVQEVVPVEQLLERANELADVIAAKAPIGVRCLKVLLNSAAEGISDEGHYHLETIYTKLTFDSEDCAEGVRAFAEKRKPIFKNC
jgi:enoyl-CoA hydratase